MNHDGLYSRLGLAVALMSGFILLSVEGMPPGLYVALLITAIAGLTAFVIDLRNGEQ